MDSGGNYEVDETFVTKKDMKIFHILFIVLPLKKTEKSDRVPGVRCASTQKSFQGGND